MENGPAFNIFLPDTKAESGQTIGLEKIAKEISNSKKRSEAKNHRTGTKNKVARIRTSLEPGTDHCDGHIS